ncbi:MAG: hypothetical protein ACOYXT_00440 [Bacteroidota bacterium]
MAGMFETAQEKMLRLWRDTWPKAREVWSPFIKLREPQWCMSSEAAAKEGLTGSFAMIRLTDHRIVIDLEKVVDLGVGDYALQVLAHEIGHHIYTPANLRDNAVLLGRIRWALADLESKAGFVANIYEDLIINDMLHRTKNLDMAVVYQQLNKDISFSSLWTLMMRAFEYLWKLNRGELATDPSSHSERIDADASLIASLVRSYSKRWIEGGGRFAALMYPYMLEEQEFQKSKHSIQLHLDTEKAGENGGMIAGLAEIDAEAIEGAIDPRAEASGKKKDEQLKLEPSFGKNMKGGSGPRQGYLNPGTYIDLCRQANPSADEQELIMQYYREVALPHLVAFPAEVTAQAGMTTPEGTDTWETGEPLEEIDWLESAIVSPQILPGYSTRKRIYGEDQDDNQRKKPLDVYIGIDCSGSMGNPKIIFSWPVLAATIIGLSALRAGAKVMGCLSGEPGSFMETKGFVTREKELLAVLTSYLGTGYAYGVPRLKTPFEKPLTKKSHAIIVTDNDIFSMLAAQVGEEDHWKIIEYALQNAGGTGTIVLHSYPDWDNPQVKRLQQMGWNIHYVTDETSLLDFAAGFSKKNYHQGARR